MNPFDLKAALRAKHEQHPVINPHTHGEWRRNLTGESGLGNPEPHILLSKIFGNKIARHR